MSAILLSITGTLLLVFAIGGALSRKLAARNTQAAFAGGQVCGMSSPDGSLTCTSNIEHLGWCSNSGVEWCADAWNCDHWAATGVAPTAKVTDAGKNYAYSEVDDGTQLDLDRPPAPAEMDIESGPPHWLLRPWIKSDESGWKFRKWSIVATIWIGAIIFNGISDALEPAPRLDMNTFPHYCYHENGDRKDGFFDIIEEGGTERAEECREKLGWWGPGGLNPQDNKQAEPFT